MLAKGVLVAVITGSVLLMRETQSVQPSECRTVPECSQAIEALRRETRLEFDQRATALEEARTSIDRRLEQMNEFRSQLKDQAGTFATAGEVNAALKLITARLDASDNQRSVMIGALAVVQFFWVVAFAVYLKRLPPRQADAVARATDSPLGGVSRVAERR